VMTVSHPRPGAPFENVAERAPAMRRIFSRYGKLFGGTCEAMFWSWSVLSRRCLSAGDPTTSARAAREAARYKPTDPRPWILWALMTTAPTLAPWTVRTVRRTRALLGR